ncbi:MAG: MlaD family protein [Acidobacteriota bacterium]
MANNRSPTLRVGGLIVFALLAFMLSVVLIGEQNNLFRPMNHYSVGFTNVQGLQAGNPVQLSGVSVGRVLSIELPTDPGEDSLRVRIAVDRRYGGRLRADSTARIQTLGLLGDKFIALTSGSPSHDVIPHDGEIPAAPATNVDRLIASGEGVMENALSISASLSRLLQRLEKGDSVLGMLIAPLPESSRERTVWETLYGFLNAMDRLSAAVESGEGPIFRLLMDRQMGDSLATSVERIERLLAQLEEGDGLLPRLLSDGELSAEAAATLRDLRATAAHFESLGKRLDSELSEEGEGLVPRLLYDDELAEQITGDLRSIASRLDRATMQLTEGDGTAAQLLNDPQIYDAINDIIVGVDESRLLRWLIRNRQKAGIKKRYRDAQDGSQAEDGSTAVDGANLETIESTEPAGGPQQP